MTLTELLGLEVVGHDGRGNGFLTDVRLELGPGAGAPQATLYGLIVSPRRSTAFTGYERTAANRPALIARFLAWRHRGTFLVLWEDVARLDTGRIELRRGYRKYSARLGRD
ncbi:PRC-barrel domain-containing protein [Sinomonas atrocyanea]